MDRLDKMISESIARGEPLPSVLQEMVDQAVAATLASGSRDPRDTYERFKAMIAARPDVEAALNRHFAEVVIVRGLIDGGAVYDPADDTNELPPRT
jgi:hypothetical protein